MNKANSELRTPNSEILKRIPPGVRAVFFDAVGTLIHPEPLAPVVYASVGRRFGSRLGVETIMKRFRAAFHREDLIDRAYGWRTSEAREITRWRYIVSTVLDDVFDAESCFRELFEHFSRPKSWRCDPLADILPTLAAHGYMQGIASNYDERLRPVVAGLPELHPLKELVISAEVGWRKPAPRFFAALCKRISSRPEQVLLVGDDRENDFEGARAAGLHAILLDPLTGII
jgi:putative hydrolase of the HAD superfamily